MQVNMRLVLNLSSDLVSRVTSFVVMLSMLILTLTL